MKATWIGARLAHASTEFASKMITCSLVFADRAGTGWCVMWRWSLVMMPHSASVFHLTAFATMELARITEKSIDVFVGKVSPEATVRRRSTNVTVLLV